MDWAIYEYQGPGGVQFTPISEEEALVLILAGTYYRDNIDGCWLTNCPCSKYAGTIRRMEDAPTV